METKNMHAIVANGYGSPEVLEYKEVEIPVQGENEILVRIMASTVTRADTMMRTGKPYFGRLFTGLRKPKHPIPGTGFSGEVVSAGEKVNRFKQGDAVFGETTLGFSTNAEYVVIPENGVVLHKPENLSHEEAATYCDGPLTSYYFLKELAKLKPGQKILINGASGSLGTAALQLAKRMGAEVTGVCSGRNARLVKSLGADHVIDYQEKDFAASDNTYDIVYDTVGKSTFSRSRKVLTDHGIYLSPVLSFGLLLRMLLTSRGGKEKAIFAASGMKKDHELRALLSDLVGIHQEGGFETIIDRQFPLGKVSSAHTYVDAGHKKGNVIIIVQS